MRPRYVVWHSHVPGWQHDWLFVPLSGDVHLWIVWLRRCSFYVGHSRPHPKKMALE